MVTAFKNSLRLLVSILVASIWAYPPQCHDYYGRPLTQHCFALLGAILNEASPLRFFTLAGLERPPGISLNQVNTISIQ